MAVSANSDHELTWAVTSSVGPAGTRSSGATRASLCAGPYSEMLEAQKDFRRINACRQLPLLKRAYAQHWGKSAVDAMENAA